MSDEDLLNFYQETQRYSNKEEKLLKKRGHVGGMVRDDKRILDWLGCELFFRDIHPRGNFCFYLAQIIEKFQYTEHHNETVTAIRWMKASMAKHIRAKEKYLRKVSFLRQRPHTRMIRPAIAD